MRSLGKRVYGVESYRRFESSCFRMPKVELTNGQTVDIKDYAYDDLVALVLKEPSFISDGITYFTKHVVQVDPDEPRAKKGRTSR